MPINRAVPPRAGGVEDGLKVTPFDTVAVKSIKSIREGNEDKIREFMKRSKNQKKWRAKKVFEKSLR